MIQPIRKAESDYKKKLESAKAQADQIILDARARAEAEQEKALERTRQEADSMLEKAYCLLRKPVSLILQAFFVPLLLFFTRLPI